MTSEEEQSDQTYERTFPHGNDFSEDDEESQLEFVESAEKKIPTEVPVLAKAVAQEFLSPQTSKTYHS